MYEHSECHFRLLFTNDLVSGLDALRRGQRNKVNVVSCPLPSPTLRLLRSLVKKMQDADGDKGSLERNIYVKNVKIIKE